MMANTKHNKPGVVAKFVQKYTVKQQAALAVLDMQSYLTILKVDDHPATKSTNGRKRVHK